MKQALLTFLLMSIFTVMVNGQDKDILGLRGSKKLISGEITKVTRDFVSVKSGGRTQEYAASEIDNRLRFRDDPSGLASVRSFYQDGRIEDASKKLETVNSEGRDIVQQDIAFFKAVIAAKLALRGKSDVTAAIQEVGAFLKQHGNSFRYYDACEVMGDLAMSLGRNEVATRYYEKLLASESSAVEARGALLLGDAFLLGGNVQQASEMYARCEQADDARIQTMGLLGLATCAVNTDPNRAIAMIEKVIAENDSEDVELFARAYNALGNAFAAAGKTEAALDAYLHTDLLFYRDSEKHAEALYHLSKLWADVNKPSEATKARQTLKQRYKSSIWAKR